MIKALTIKNRQIRGHANFRNIYITFITYLYTTLNTDCCIGFDSECCLFKNTETMAWNIMQSSLHCCGINNYTDWLLLPSLTVPSSCQRNVTIPTDYKEYGENPFFTDGCYGIVKKRLDTDMMIINCRLTFYTY